MGIDSGFFSLQETGNTLMEQGQTGQPDMGIGRQQERIVMLPVILGQLESRKL